MIKIPEQFTRDTIHREGESGRRWIASLPKLVERICEGWDLTIDGPPMHGYIGLVVPVKRGDELLVLKVSWIDYDSRDEAAALRAWDGNGAVRLEKIDSARAAMLMERLGYTRSLSSVKIEEAIEIAGRLLRRLAINPPSGLRSQQDESARMTRAFSRLSKRHEKSIPKSVVDEAMSALARIAEPRTSLLVNYDLHYDNVLAGTREPWLAIDPKVIAGDAEFGVAQLMWNRLEEMELSGGIEHHFNILCGAAGLDVALARDWTLVRTVDYWLWALSVDFTEDPKRCAKIAAWLVK